MNVSALTFAPLQGTQQRKILSAPREPLSPVPRNSSESTVPIPTEKRLPTPIERRGQWWMSKVVKVLFENRRWYKGIILKYDPNARRGHFIRYTDGDEEYIDADAEHKAGKLKLHMETASGIRHEIRLQKERAPAVGSSAPMSPANTLASALNELVPSLPPRVEPAAPLSPAPMPTVAHKPFKIQRRRPSTPTFVPEEVDTGRRTRPGTPTFVPPAWPQATSKSMHRKRPRSRSPSPVRRMEPRWFEKEREQARTFRTHRKPDQGVPVGSMLERVQSSTRPHTTPRPKAAAHVPGTPIELVRPRKVADCAALQSFHTPRASTPHNIVRLGGQLAAYARGWTIGGVDGGGPVAPFHEGTVHRPLRSSEAVVPDHIKREAACSLDPRVRDAERKGNADLLRWAGYVF